MDVRGDGPVPLAFTLVVNCNSSVEDARPADFQFPEMANIGNHAATTLSKSGTHGPIVTQLSDARLGATKQPNFGKLLPLTRRIWSVDEPTDKAYGKPCIIVVRGFYSEEEVEAMRYYLDALAQKGFADFKRIQGNADDAAGGRSFGWLKKQHRPVTLRKMQSLGYVGVPDDYIEKAQKGYDLVTNFQTRVQSACFNNHPHYAAFTPYTAGDSNRPGLIGTHRNCDRQIGHYDSYVGEGVSVFLMLHPEDGLGKCHAKDFSQETLIVRAGPGDLVMINESTSHCGLAANVATARGLPEFMQKEQYEATDVIRASLFQYWNRRLEPRCSLNTAAVVPHYTTPVEEAPHSLHSLRVTHVTHSVAWQAYLEQPWTEGTLAGFMREKLTQGMTGEWNRDPKQDAMT